MELVRRAGGKRGRCVEEWGRRDAEMGDAGRAGGNGGGGGNGDAGRAKGLGERGMPEMQELWAGGREMKHPFFFHTWG